MTTKETEAFFHLRNHVRDVMRAQSARVEEALTAERGSG